LTRFLPWVLTVGLVVGSAGAFVVTERLKLERSPILRTFVDKAVSPESSRRAEIAFRLRRADTVSLAIVDSHNRLVRGFHSRHVRAGSQTFYWNGRDNGGHAVPDGTYRPRVHLRAPHRTILLPNPIVVDTKRPHITFTRTNLAAVSPDGDARHDYLTVFYRTSEPARAVLYANGRRVVKLKSYQAHSLHWGRANGMPTRPGRYRLQLRSIDQAGNPGPPSRLFTIQIRYIELGLRVIHATRGGQIRVRVFTDAYDYFWRIGPRHGHAHSRLLSLAAGPAGRYVLVVSEREHLAKAVVTVKQ
jgi:FlgD Ig-like domain